MTTVTKDIKQQILSGWKEKFVGINGELYDSTKWYPEELEAFLSSAIDRVREDRWMDRLIEVDRDGGVIDVCGLCGNEGFVETEGQDVRCICPNGELTNLKNNNE